MQKIFLLFSLVYSIVAPSVCRSQQILNDSITNNLRISIQGFKDRYHSPSIVVVLVHDQKIIFSEALGYTDLENKIAATINSKYPILSVTKMFTATMFMQLRQNKIVGLEDDVKKYVPEYKAVPGNDSDRDITLFQLATHTSGLPRNSQADINFTKQIDRCILTGADIPAIEPSTKKEFLHSLKFINKEYPDFELLSYNDRNYSNLGYSLLGIALERAVKTDYADYVVKKICKPLKMENSGFDTERIGQNMLAKGYYYNDSSKDFKLMPVFKANSALYAGGMYSTASDLAKFISFQFDNDIHSEKILSKKNKAMMQSFKIGWKPSFPYVLHEGSMLGFRCEIVVNPELKIGWVILTNTTDFDFSRINDVISKLIMPVFIKKPITELSKYTGTYRLTGGYDSLIIYLKDGNLYSSYLQDKLPQRPLTFSGNNKFKGPANGNYSIAYDFITNERYEIKVLNMGQLMWIKQ